jgi:hypothetical protein
MIKFESENRIRVEEAIESAENNGIYIDLQEFANEIYGDANPKSSKQSLYYLRTGHNKTIDRERVHIICNRTGVTPGFLFDY